MKKFQILTHGNENLAKAIQDKLFELGFNWDAGEPRDPYHYPHAAVYQAGAFGHLSLTYSHLARDEWGPVITIDELFAMQPEVKETIKIGDATYDKAEFEAATKNLTPIK